MNETLLVLLGLLWTFLTSVVMFVLGQRWERKRQSLLVRAQMLDPIRDWLGGVERFIGILGDTLSSVVTGSPGPQTYDFEERRKSAQFMIENTNEVLGIAQSESLLTSPTKSDARELSEIIQELDHDVKHTLLPLDHDILDRSAKGMLVESYIVEVGETKLALEKKVQRAYALIARIKTSLT